MHKQKNRSPLSNQWGREFWLYIQRNKAPLIRVNRSIQAVVSKPPSVRSPANKMLLRILCLILVTALQAGADNKVLGQPLDNFGAIIFGGALLSDKYAKIAREIVHNASKNSSISELHVGHFYGGRAEYFPIGGAQRPTDRYPLFVPVRLHRIGHNCYDKASERIPNGRHLTICR